MKAKKRFCRMLPSVARLRRMALEIPRRSPLTSVIPALCMATSVPVPMAMPTSASLSAGASLMPSPAIATCRPVARSAFTLATFPSGSTSASTASRPRVLATASAVRRLSPVSITMFSPSSCNSRIASGVVSLIGSATATTPAGLPSTATNIAVLPSCWSLIAMASSGSSPPTPSSRRNAGFPTSTLRPPTLPATPPAVTDRKSTTAVGTIPCSAAPRTMAAASGCSLLCSSEAASCSNSFAVIPSDGSVSTSRGFPSVSVPVLSITSVVTFSRRSRASAFFTSTPSCAPRPTPTMIDIGVARPRAQGHAMIRTATAFTIAWARRGSGPTKIQIKNVSTAAPTTNGTKIPPTRSARPWIGARLRCASATIATIWPSSVSLPMRSACMTKLPVPFTVPPVTLSPLPFSTGSGSPVIIDSSTLLRPSRTTPSTGTLSPGTTRSRSPTLTRSSGTSSSPFSPTRRAVGGARFKSALIALPVRLRARSSSTWPRSTSTMMTAAASK